MLTDEELHAICEQELARASSQGDLSEERADAMDRYNGELYGDEDPDRSQVRTREVLDTVEWILPSLMRIFADAENLVVFEPQGPEDVEAAKQETAAVEHVFWRKNRGFYVLYAFLKDALLQKTGIVKTHWDPSKMESREEYRGLDAYGVASILSDPHTELLEHAVDEDGAIDIAVMISKGEGRIVIEPCPPEEYGVPSDARTPFADDQDFLWHRTRKTKARLVDMGFSRDIIEPLPGAETIVAGSEQIARRFLSNERDFDNDADHWSMEQVWLTECYIRIDRNDDGISELYKVSLAGADSQYASGTTLLDVEEVDTQPFDSWSPILRTHTYHGHSIADLVMDLQRIKTTLFRQMLDNTYLANNGRVAVNDAVNIDDLLTPRPGGIVRTAGQDAPGQHIFPFPQPTVPQEAFQMMETVDSMRKHRTGAGEEVGALEGNELAKINTGVAALAYDAARSKIELIARICAEIGIAPMFRRIHELLRKHHGRELSIKLDGEWVSVRPQSWRERTDMEIAIGIGNMSRERKLLSLDNVMDHQQRAVEGGGMGVLVTPAHIYRAASDYTRELGLQPSLYWMDPAEAQPAPPAPDYQAAQLQVQQGQVESLMQRNQVEALKISSNERIRMAELEQKERELDLRAEIEGLKGQLSESKQARDAMAKDDQAAMNAAIAERESELKLLEIQLRDMQEAAKRESEIYRALLQSSAGISPAQASVVGVDVPDRGAGPDDAAAALEMARQLASVTAELQARMDEQSKPKAIEYGPDGLIAKVGGVAIVRDTAGQLVSIG